MIRLGTTPHLISRPIDAGITAADFDHTIDLHANLLGENCRLLLAQKLDAALISAADYARHSSELQILRPFAVTSERQSLQASLFFRTGLSEFVDVAMPAASQDYQPLAQVVLSEFFEQDVEWTDVEDQFSIEQLLQFHPACLLTSEAAVEAAGKQENYLDLPSEWFDKTESCFVHQLLVTRRGFAVEELLDALEKSRHYGMEHLSDIARSSSLGDPEDWSTNLAIINEFHHYFPNEETWDALRQYFEYLFYYGIIDYLPDLRFAD